MIFLYEIFKTFLNLIVSVEFRLYVLLVTIVVCNFLSFGFFFEIVASNILYRL